MSQQLSFDLPVIPALGRDDFMIAPSNAVAVAMIEATQDWVGEKLVLCGPTGSGKTHLAHVWAGTQNGQIIVASDLIDADIPALALTPTAIENLPDIAKNQAAQTALFHLHNLMQSNGQPLLMTGTGAPNHWGMSLPDLQSRIDAAGVATLNAPDDTLLSAVIAKQFNDRQLMPRPDVIPYLVLRIDRSFAAARDVVAAMDEHSLSRHKPLTRALAGQVLDNLG
jgi:chromosomal replication initiation ATPase DnaA|tara:strand:- start:16491 stop:17162 length:672 start_codon:yes stop_codon:yes gene_type:complete